MDLDEAFKVAFTRGVETRRRESISWSCSLCFCCRGYHFIFGNKLLVDGHAIVEVVDGPSQSLVVIEVMVVHQLVEARLYL